MFFPEFGSALSGVAQSLRLEASQVFNIQCGERNEAILRNVTQPLTMGDVSHVTGLFVLEEEGDQSQEG